MNCSLRSPTPRRRRRDNEYEASAWVPSWTSAHRLPAAEDATSDFTARQRGRQPPKARDGGINLRAIKKNQQSHATNH